MLSLSVDAWAPPETFKGPHDDVFISTIAGRGGGDSEPKIEIGVDFCGRLPCRFDEARWSRLKQASSYSSGNRLGTTLSLQFVEDVVEMLFHGSHRNHQLLSNRTIGSTNSE